MTDAYAYFYGGPNDGQLARIDAELSAEINRSFRYGQYIDTGHRVIGVAILGLYTVVPIDKLRAKVAALMAQRMIESVHVDRFARYIHQSQAVIVIYGCDVEPVMQRLRRHEEPPDGLDAFVAETPPQMLRSDLGYLLAQWWDGNRQLATVAGTIRPTEPVQSIREFATRFEDHLAQVGVCQDQAECWKSLSI